MSRLTPTLCRFDGCGRPSRVFDLCYAHALQRKSGGDLCPIEKKPSPHRIHGEGPRGANTPEYQAWTGMRGRCLTPTNRVYALYGGRDISICERWSSYPAFLADMGRKPSPKHSLDRVNNNGNYEPANCRWATAKEQARNRRCVPLHEFKGRKMSLPEVCERVGLSIVMVSQRLRAGWAFDVAISKPPRGAEVRP